MSRLLPQGLTARLLAAATLLIALVVAGFGTLALAVGTLRAETSERDRAEAVVTAVADLQKSVLDLETGVRAFAITEQPRFLDPWRQARPRLPAEAAALERAVTRSATGGRAEVALAQRIRRAAQHYLLDYSQPLVARLQSRGLDRQERIAQIAEGKRRVDALRALFANLLATESRRAQRERDEARSAGRRALILALAGLVAIVTLIAAGVTYLARTVTRPVARVANAAGAIAADPARAARPVSPPRTSAAREIASLTRSFDAMATAVREQRARVERQNATLERRVRERTADAEDARRQALLMLAVAAEYRDDDTHRHTQRVGRNAALLATELGLSPEAIELIRDAAPLHDIGKIGIPDAILLKPGKLTTEQFEAMKRHVAIGESILAASPAPLFHVAAEIALTHHERFDGSGYLRHLAGEQIPLAGRIVAVVDVFDALTHARPYKQAWSVERAVEEIRRGSGTHFDPAVVAAFDALDPSTLAADPEPLLIAHS